jgi:UDP-N-acetylmuramyl pentapeptide phosphotransferase/UDP-N-acetylglucosamine-1-phosphate transferase
VIWAAPLLALATASAGIVVLMRERRHLPQSLPNARSLHGGAIPRVGGLAILAGAGAGLVLAPAAAGSNGMPGIVVAVATAIIAGISLADDIRAVRATLRLAVHGLASLAVAIAFAASVPPINWPLTLLVALALAWMANLYNFMDGNDGLAASAALLGFATYGLAAVAAGRDPTPYACIAAACLPFLAVNWPPARMFLGDVGALPLGFLAAALGLAGIAAGAWPAWLPLLAFLPFIVDATVTLAARALRGERVWEAHKVHYYQRLHQLGAAHNGTLAVYGGLAAGCCITALFCIFRAPQAGWSAVAMWLVVLAVVFATIDYHWRSFTSSP